MKSGAVHLIVTTNEIKILYEIKMQIRMLSIIQTLYVKQIKINQIK